MSSRYEPRVSIILLNLNNYQDTRACLESLQAVYYRQLDIIVVDNGSSDESCTRIKSDFPGVTLISNRHNVGFATGNNLGIRDALRRGADYVLLLNNDTIVDQSFLCPLVEVAEKDPNIGVLGSKIFYEADPKRLWYAGGHIAYLRGLCVHLGFNQLDEQRLFSKVIDTDFISGCVMMVRSSVFCKVGLLEDKLFVYWEDADFCMRVQKAGYRCVFVPTSQVWHKISRTCGQQSPFTLHLTTRNHLFWVKNHVPYPYKPLALPLAIARKLGKLARLSLRNDGSAAAVWSGLSDFVLGRYGPPNFKRTPELPSGAD